MAFKVQTDPPISNLWLEHVIVTNGEVAVDIGRPTDEDGKCDYAVSYVPYPQYTRVREGQEYTGRTETVAPRDGASYDLTLIIDCPLKRLVGDYERTILCVLWRALKRWYWFQGG